MDACARAAIVVTSTMRRLPRTSYIYLAWATVAGIIAIARDLPAGFAGQASGLPVRGDFVFGMGTALSPPVWWMVIQLLLTRWAARSDRRRRAGVLGLIVFGLLECIGALGEPITYEVFSPSTLDPGLALIQSGMIALPAAMAWFGFLARRA